MLDFVWSVLVFFAFVGCILGGYAWFTRQNRATQQRTHMPMQGSEGQMLVGSSADLSLSSPSSPEISLLAKSTPDMLLGQATPSLAFPTGEEDQSELVRELRAAGHYRPGALTDFLALRTVLVVLPLLAAGLIGLFVTTDTTNTMLVLGGGVVMAMLGFAVPRLALRSQGNARALAIERGLPAAIDMLTLCLASGQNVLNSLQRVSKEIGRAFPTLAEELQIVHRQAELRTLDFALAQFADRINLPHLRNLAVILSQSEHLGTDAVSILREYADNLRMNQKQRADEMSNRAPFRMLFPAYMMAIGAAILILAPAVMELTEFRRSNMLGGVRSTMPGDIKQGAPATLPNLNDQTAPPAPAVPDDNGER
jgi:tight adherence protein C